MPDALGVGSLHPTKKQVLAELEVAIAQRERAMHANPYEIATSQQVITLRQVRVLASTVEIADMSISFVMLFKAALSRRRI